MLSISILCHVVLLVINSYIEQELLEFTPMEIDYKIHLRHMIFGSVSSDAAGKIICFSFGNYRRSRKPVDL